MSASTLLACFLLLAFPDPTPAPPHCPYTHAHCCRCVSAVSAIPAVSFLTEELSWSAVPRLDDPRLIGASSISAHSNVLPFAASGLPLTSPNMSLAQPLEAVAALPGSSQMELQQGGGAMTALPTAPGHRPLIEISCLDLLSLLANNYSAKWSVYTVSAVGRPLHLQLSALELRSSTPSPSNPT